MKRMWKLKFYQNWKKSRSRNTLGFFWKVDFYTVKCNTYCKGRMWGVFFMPDDKVLQVAILIWGCAFCAIAALCMFLSSNYDREKRRYLILMESFASLLLLMDAMAHIFSGYPGVSGSVMVRISSFLVFVLTNVARILPPLQVVRWIAHLIISVQKNLYSKKETLVLPSLM